MIGILVGSGEIYDYSVLKSYIKDDSYIICSDGGLEHCHKINVTPNLIVGDFDSVSSNVLQDYIDKNIKVITLLPEKDFTDMEVAVDLALEKNCTEINIFGGIGSRFDHSFGNLHILIKLAKKNIKAKLINEKNVVLVSNKLIKIKKEKKYISLIPLTENTIVSTIGLKYQLLNESIYFGETRGISNEFDKEECEIDVKSGLVCIVLSSD